MVCYGGNIIWLWWQGPVMTCSYLGRSGSRKMHANIQLPFSLFPSCLVWDHGMELHAFTCPSFNHLWKCTETCLKVCPTKVFPNPVHREFQFLVMVNSYFCREVVIYQAFQWLFVFKLYDLGDQDYSIFFSIIVEYLKWVISRGFHGSWFWKVRHWQLISGEEKARWGWTCLFFTSLVSW